VVNDEDFPNDEAVPTIPNGELPHCPKCNGLLRPAVVFFNEQLPGSNNLTNHQSYPGQTKVTNTSGRLLSDLY